MLTHTETLQAHPQGGRDAGRGCARHSGEGVMGRGGWGWADRTGQTLTSGGVASRSEAPGWGRSRFYPLSSAVSLQNGGRGRALTSRPFPSPVPSRHASGGGQRGRGWAGRPSSLPPPWLGAPPIRA